MVVRLFSILELQIRDCGHEKWCQTKYDRGKNRALWEYICLAPTWGWQGEALVERKWKVAHRGQLTVLLFQGAVRLRKRLLPDGDLWESAFEFFYFIVVLQTVTYFLMLCYNVNDEKLLSGLFNSPTDKIKNTANNTLNSYVFI